MILDDSTSAVDTATEGIIRQRMQEFLPDMTRIIIAQRITSVKHADQIILLDDGRISDTGTHVELYSEARFTDRYMNPKRKERICNGKICRI